MPTNLLSLGDDINPSAWMNLLDDAPQGLARTASDRRPEEAMRPYRALACAVISQTLADIGRQAVENLDAALEVLEDLSTSELWGT